LDIAATDQIRPIATTMAIAMDVLRTAFPSACVELGAIGLASFSPPQCEVVHTCATFFETRPRKAKENAMTLWSLIPCHR
jgi:hypothetical protein